MRNDEREREKENVGKCRKKGKHERVEVRKRVNKREREREQNNRALGSQAQLPSKDSPEFNFCGIVLFLSTAVALSMGKKCFLAGSAAMIVC